MKTITVYYTNYAGEQLTFKCNLWSNTLEAIVRNFKRQGYIITEIKDSRHSRIVVPAPQESSATSPRYLDALWGLHCAEAGAGTHDSSWVQAYIRSEASRRQTTLTGRHPSAFEWTNIPLPTRRAT